MPLLSLLILCLLCFGTYKHIKLRSVADSLRRNIETTTVELTNSQKEAARLKSATESLHQKIEQDAANRRNRALEYKENDIKRPEVQLRVLANATIRQKRILNNEETPVFYAALRVAKRLPCLVFAQVSMGEIMRTEDSEEGKTAHSAINSKRIDILICDTSGFPILAIEHQGSGHYGNGAEDRDAVKRLALERAGIALLETFPDIPPHELEQLIFAAVSKSKNNPHAAAQA